MVTAGTKTNTKTKLTLDSFFNKELNTYEYPFKYFVPVPIDLYKIIIEDKLDDGFMVTIKVKENDKWYLYRASEYARNMYEAIKIANKFYKSVGTKTNTKTKLTLDSFFNKELNTYEYPFKYFVPVPIDLYKIIIEDKLDDGFMVTIKVKENDKWYLYRASEYARNMYEAIKIANKFYKLV